MMSRAVRFITYVGLLSAFATVLMFWQFPVPFMPVFLTLDVSDVPVVIGARLFGWAAGAAIAVVKGLLHLFASSSFGIGEIANGILSLTFITVLQLFRRSGLFAYALATASVALVACILNFTVLLPAYQYAFGISTEQLLALTRQAGRNVYTIWDFLLAVIIPFNLVKGGLVSALSLPIVRRLSRYIRAAGQPL